MPPPSASSTTQGTQASQLQATPPVHAAGSSSASQVPSPTHACDCQPSCLVPFRTCRQTCFATSGAPVRNGRPPSGAHGAPWSPLPAHAIKAAACGGAAHPSPRLATTRLLPSSRPPCRGMAPPGLPVLCVLSPLATPLPQGTLGFQPAQQQPPPPVPHAPSRAKLCCRPTARQPSTHPWTPRPHSRGWMPPTCRASSFGTSRRLTSRTCT